jgi:membrane protein YqaA with SNARE-associated domain
MSRERHDGQWWLMVVCFWLGLFMVIASDPAFLPL